MDDLFLVLPPDKIQEVLNIFNSLNEHIKFTVEVEENARLPFLDLLVIRQNDRSIRTEGYSKKISSGRFLNYYSLHPMHQKINVAINFAKRVKTFSTNLNQQQIKKVIHRQLRLNDFPMSLINRIITRIDEKDTTRQNDTAMEVSSSNSKPV